MAARMETYGKSMTPAERWQESVKKLYPITPAGQKKSAPRAAFLGLCEAGFIKGISPTPATPANKSKTYATEAAALLLAGTHKTVSQLWNAVTGDQEIPHAFQMDVVVALWKNGLISPTESPHS